MNASQVLLSVRQLCKSYGAVRVLSDLNLDLNCGEVHALVGENGAGKSTLCRILCGLTPPDSGSLQLEGLKYSPSTQKHARQCGIRMVMQELNLVANLTIAESLFLDQLPHRFGWIDRQHLRMQARRALKTVGLHHMDPDQYVQDLGIGHQQLVEIAAGLTHRCRLLILDEPTAALTDPEVELLFQRIKELQAAGSTVLYIPHRLEEEREIANRISVLRDGQLIVTRPASELSLPEIVRHMVGRDLEHALLRQARPLGPVALRVSGLRRAPAVKDVSFEVRRGEILGVAGLMGSGRTESMRAIFGADQAEAGELYIGDSTQPAKIGAPRDSVRHGIALLTEDRKNQGLLLPMSIKANISLPSLARIARGGGWIQRVKEQELAEQWVTRLKLRYRDVDQPVGELSGGNQQKVVLARWLARDCQILIFDEPTRGVDVGAKWEIYRVIQELAATEKAIIIVSSDLKELLALSDRIVVMSLGRVVTAFDHQDFDQDQIMAAALRDHLV
jgi:ribose transport system ATP-binding protein